jgi:N-acetylmuramoyl-L-alanine amidase
MNKLIILDNGHGEKTPGKRSPVWPGGSQLFEYEFNRDIVERIALQLREEDIDYHILVPELDDISLPERCRRANERAKKHAGETVLISIHANAGGGTGWECYTSKGNTKADAYATILFNEAKLFFPDRKMRADCSDGDPDKESQFYILKHTVCPAVLTENFFMDNPEDCRYVMSAEGRKRIAGMHVSAIRKMVEL